MKELWGCGEGWKGERWSFFLGVSKGENGSAYDFFFFFFDNWRKIQKGRKEVTGALLIALEDRHGREEGKLVKRCDAEEVW